jgi:hypothetical protein
VRLLTPDRYRRMPWANGLGVTVELLRLEDATGLVLRLSRAQVVAEGPFSVLPGVERNLTVLSGPGFELHGDGIRLKARRLRPLAFSGDLALVARKVSGPSEDFNVMTAARLPRPDVRLLGMSDTLDPGPGEVLLAYALAAAQVSGVDMPEQALLVSEAPLQVAAGGPVLAVAVAGLSPDQIRKIG